MDKLSKADRVRLNRYGVFVGVLISKNTPVIYTVTQKSIKKGQGINSYNDYEYFIHKGRRKIASCESFSDLDKWAKMLSLVYSTL